MPHDIQLTQVVLPAGTAVSDGWALGDGDFLPVMKASTNKGGLTVVAASIHNAGTAFIAHFALENWGTAGTAIKSTSAGTVITQGSTGTAGTTTHAGTAPGAAFVLTAANEYVDQGEWLVLRREGTAPMEHVTFQVEWIQGRAGN